MRFVLVLLLLAGCARRYMLITAGPMLDCPQEQLKSRQLEDPIWYRVTGCGRAVYCQQLIWAGADEWACQGDAPEK